MQIWKGPGKNQVRWYLHLSTAILWLGKLKGKRPESFPIGVERDTPRDLLSVVSKGKPRAPPQNVKAIATAVGYMPDLDRKTLLLRILCMLGEIAGHKDLSWA